MFTPELVTTLFTCPLSKMTFREPVLGSDGQSYELMKLLIHLQINGNISPITGERFSHFTYNTSLKNAIDGQSALSANRYSEYDAEGPSAVNDLMKFIIAYPTAQHPISFPLTESKQEEESMLCGVGAIGMFGTAAMAAMKDFVHNLRHPGAEKENEEEAPVMLVGIISKNR